jgi:hypothetical protein
MKAMTQIRSFIQQKLPYLRFQKISTLFFVSISEELHEYEETEEFASERGLLISETRLPVTLVAGNRTTNSSEIWLYRDGTLHEYHASATWESIECEVTERHYIGPASEERVSFKDLQEAIEFNLEADDDDER